MSYHSALESSSSETSHYSSTEANNLIDNGSQSEPSTSQSPCLRQLHKLAKSDAEHQYQMKASIKKPRKSDLQKTERQRRNIRSAVICRATKLCYITRLEESISVEEEKYREIMGQIFDVSVNIIRMRERIATLEKRVNFRNGRSSPVDHAIQQADQSVELTEELLPANEGCMPIWSQSMDFGDDAMEYEEMPLTPTFQEDTTDSCVSVEVDGIIGLGTNFKKGPVGSPVSVLTTPDFEC